MFISEAYTEKLWTNHEREAAQARAFRESKEHILPVRFDDTKIPGLLPTIDYLSLKNRSPDDLATRIVEKLSPNKGLTASGPAAASSIVRTAAALQLEVGESGGFFETKSNNLYTRIRTLKLKVSNQDSYGPLTECRVHVMNIDPHEYDGPWLIKEWFSLAAGDHVFVPLASYLEANDIRKSPYGASFMEILAFKNRPLPPTGRRHVLTVRSTALGSPFCEIKCTLWVDESGQLRIERNNNSAPGVHTPSLVADTETPRIILTGGVDHSAEILRKYMKQNTIGNVTITTVENRIALHNTSSDHTLEIVFALGEASTMREDLGNHPHGFQTKVTSQVPRWSHNGPPMTQSEMLIRAKKWLSEQAAF